MTSDYLAALYGSPTLHVELTHSEIMDGRLRDPVYRGARLNRPHRAISLEAHGHMLSGDPECTRRHICLPMYSAFPGFAACPMRPTRTSCGTVSLSNSSRFP